MGILGYGNGRSLQATRPLNLALFFVLTFLFCQTHEPFGFIVNTHIHDDSPLDGTTTSVFGVSQTENKTRVPMDTANP